MSGWVPAGSDISDIDALHEHGGGAHPYRTTGEEPERTPDSDAEVDEFVNSWGREEKQGRWAA